MDYRIDYEIETEQKPVKLASQMPSNYEVGDLRYVEWLEEKLESYNSDYAKCNKIIQQLCGALNLQLDNDSDEMKLHHIYHSILELKSIIKQVNKHFT